MALIRAVLQVQLRKKVEEWYWGEKGPNSADGRFMGEGTRGAAEAWGDGTAAFIDGESPHCLA